MARYERTGVIGDSERAYAWKSYCTGGPLRRGQFIRLLTLPSLDIFSAAVYAFSRMYQRNVDSIRFSQW